MSDTHNFLYLQAELETVAKITHEKGKKNDSQKAKYGTKTVAFVLISELFYYIQSAKFFWSYPYMHFIPTNFSLASFCFWTVGLEHSNFRMFSLWKMKNLMM